MEKQKQMLRQLSSNKLSTVLNAINNPPTTNVTIDQQHLEESHRTMTDNRSSKEGSRAPVAVC